MKPGDTTSPRASITVVPVSGSADTAAIRPPVIPTSRTASRFVSGSMTRPPRMTRSNVGRLRRDCTTLDQHEHRCERVFDAFRQIDHPLGRVGLVGHRGGSFFATRQRWSHDGPYLPTNSSGVA